MGLIFALSALIVYIFRYAPRKRATRYVTMCALCVLMLAAYEACVPVLLCLFFQTEAVSAFYGNKDKRAALKEFLHSLLILFLLLVASYAVYRGVSWLIRIMCGYEYAAAGRIIAWNLQDPGGSIKNFIMSFGFAYFLSGLYYLPIGIYVVCVIGCFVVCCCMIRKKPIVSLWLLACFGTTCLMPLLLGTAAPYRTALVLAPFCAFFVMILCQAATACGKKMIQCGLIGVCCLLPVVQAIDYNNWAYVDYLRYRDDAAIMEDVAYDIGHFCQKGKPVIFLGKPSLALHIVDEIYLSRETLAGKIMTKIESWVGFRISDMQPLTKAYDGYVYCYQQSIESVIAWAVASGDIYEVFKMEGYDICRASETAVASAAGNLVAGDPNGAAALVDMEKYRIYETDAFIAVVFQ